ncbi:hypothetical protein QP775_07230 [Paenibacillus sp. UMB4589-SE434]|nr:hypothetical protein [Paenibacillus sp. UMB4589-SE434]
MTHRRGDMSSKEVIFKSDQIRQLQNKLLELSEETNLLRQRLNGQANSWSTELPIWGSVHQAQREINRLTEDAEKLAEVVRKAVQGVEKVQQENQRGAEKWAQQAMNLTHLLGKYQQQAVNSYVQVVGSMGKAANHLVERIAQMFRQDELSHDPTVKQLQQLLRTQGLPDGLRIQSEQKLQAIFDARNLIAKSQVAYEVYKRYGNKKLMEQAHKQAKASRKLLKAMGIQHQQFEGGKEGIYRLCRRLGNRANRDDGSTNTRLYPIGESLQTFEGR